MQKIKLEISACSDTLKQKCVDRILNMNFIFIGENKARRAWSKTNITAIQYYNENRNITHIQRVILKYTGEDYSKLLYFIYKFCLITHQNY